MLKELVLDTKLTRLSILLNKKHNSTNQSESHLKYYSFKIKKGVSIILKRLLSMIFKLQEIFFDPALFLLAYWKLSRAESSKVIRGQVNHYEKHFILHFTINLLIFSRLFWVKFLLLPPNRTWKETKLVLFTKLPSPKQSLKK